jgi:hypothetical protein
VNALAWAVVVLALLLAAAVAVAVVQTVRRREATGEALRLRLHILTYPTRRPTPDLYAVVDPQGTWRR